MLTQEEIDSLTQDEIDEWQRVKDYQYKQIWPHILEATQQIRLAIIALDDTGEYESNNLDDAYISMQEAYSILMSMGPPDGLK